MSIEQYLFITLLLVVFGPLLLRVVFSIIFSTYFRKKAEHTRSIFDASTDEENNDGPALPPAESRGENSGRRKDERV